MVVVVRRVEVVVGRFGEMFTFKVVRSFSFFTSSLLKLFFFSFFQDSCPPPHYHNWMNEAFWIYYYFSLIRFL
jgi:hypothetical protein